MSILGLVFSTLLEKRGVRSFFNQANLCGKGKARFKNIIYQKQKK